MRNLIFFFLFVFLLALCFLYWLNFKKKIKLYFTTYVFLFILGIIGVVWASTTPVPVLDWAPKINGWGDLMGWIFSIVFLFFITPFFTYFIGTLFCFVVNRNRILSKEYQYKTHLFNVYVQYAILFVALAQIYTIYLNTS